VGAQERAPGVVARFRRRDPAGPQDLADGGRADAVAEAAQLALDPHHVPAPVLLGEPHDQLHQFRR